jgi:hypothetical protein
MSTTADPGWYDDGSGRLRWWDGSRWTEDYAEFGRAGVEIRADAVPPSTTPVGAGWYDDGRGRQRWWDGHAWTQQTRFSGDEDAFAGIVVDGRWLHSGELSLPIAGVVASVLTVDELSRRPSLGHAVRSRALFSPQGVMTPRQFARLDRRAIVLAVEGPGQVWITWFAPQDEPRARQFSTWINRSAEHYRYR